MEKSHFFITGTDTDVGKTLVSTALLHLARQKGLETAALKPVSAGCDHSEEGLRNSDALALQQTMTAKLRYEEVNPIALEPAIAPHIAAAQVGKAMDVDALSRWCQSILKTSYPFVLMEGAGGWRVPLNPKETLADLANSLNLKIILVVGMRLGCLNHALLTAEAIARDGLHLAGWVANQLDDDMLVVEENLATLAHRFHAPCIGHIPFLHKPCAIDAAKYLDIDKLLD